MVQAALRAAGKPSPNRGYGKRTPDLEASGNVRLRAYSPSCLECEFSEVRLQHPAWSRPVEPGKRIPPARRIHPRLASRLRQLCRRSWNLIGGSPTRSKSGLKLLFTTF